MQPKTKVMIKRTFITLFVISALITVFITPHYNEDKKVDG